MLLRNVNQALGLANSTSLAVKQLATHVLTCRVVSGSHVGRTALISRMAVTPSDKSMPFAVRRIQFPVRPALGMTIKKSQGQTLEEVGIFLPKDLFSHGQLYSGSQKYLPTLQAVSATPSLVQSG